MKNLRRGDVLIRISDKSKWEFVRPSLGFVTVSAENSDFKGSSGETGFIYVKMVDPVRLSQQGERRMRLSDFEKAGDESGS